MVGQDSEEQGEGDDTEESDSADNLMFLSSSYKPTKVSTTSTSSYKKPTTITKSSYSYTSTYKSPAYSSSHTYY